MLLLSSSPQQTTKQAETGKMRIDDITYPRSEVAAHEAFIGDVTVFLRVLFESRRCCVPSQQRCFGATWLVEIAHDEVQGNTLRSDEGIISTSRFARAPLMDGPSDRARAGPGDTAG